MIARKSDGRHEQSVPSNEWTFTVPTGRTNVELIGVFSLDGRTAVQYDSIDFTSGVLTIFFGIDNTTGVARYEYDAEDDGSTVITGTGGVINVHVTQKIPRDSEPAAVIPFSGVTEVIVSMAAIRFGFVEVRRGTELIPMVIRPSLINGNFVYQFDQPETGIVY